MNRVKDAIQAAEEAKKRLEAIAQGAGGMDVKQLVREAKEARSLWDHAYPEMRMLQLRLTFSLGWWRMEMGQGICERGKALVLAQVVPAPPTDHIVLDRDLIGALGDALEGIKQTRNEFQLMWVKRRDDGEITMMDQVDNEQNTALRTLDDQEKLLDSCNKAVRKLVVAWMMDVDSKAADLRHEAEEMMEKVPMCLSQS